MELEKSNDVKHVNITILLGEIISEVKILDNGRLVTFMIETKSNISGKNKTISEKHKIVCFDGLASFVADKIKQGNLVHVIGSNRSKMIVSNAEDKKTISRDVVASQVSII
jgi:single-stranded DNA-binding protein